MTVDRKTSIKLLLLSFLTIGIVSFQLIQSAQTNASVVLPQMSLVVIGADGNQVVLNETDIAGLSSYTSYGGYKNQLGILRGLGNYTGVSLSTLCSLVGGITNSCKLKIIANDSYTITLSYGEVNGEFTTYDNVTAAEVPHNQPLVPIIAYYFNDTDIPTSDGPLRLAIVGPEGLATTSTYWVKQVVRVEIVDTLIPEFSRTTVLSLILLTSLAAASAALIVYRRRQSNTNSP